MHICELLYFVLLDSHVMFGVDLFASVVWSVIVQCHWPFRWWKHYTSTHSAEDCQYILRCSWPAGCFACSWATWGWMSCRCLCISERWYL